MNTWYPIIPCWRKFKRFASALALYIGSTTERGLQRLVYEVVDITRSTSAPRRLQPKTDDIQADAVFA